MIETTIDDFIVDETKGEKGHSNGGGYFDEAPSLAGYFNADENSEKRKVATEYTDSNKNSVIMRLESDWLPETQSFPNDVIFRPKSLPWNSDVVYLDASESLRALEQNEEQNEEQQGKWLPGGYKVEGWTKHIIKKEESDNLDVVYIQDRLLLNYGGINPNYLIRITWPWQRYVE